MSSVVRRSTAASSCVFCGGMAWYDGVRDETPKVYYHGKLISVKFVAS